MSSSSIKLILSDLHLADGHPLMEGFGTRQQTAFEGLLQAASDGRLPEQSDDVELIINGDCFDFLAIPPYNTHGFSDPTTAVTKLEKIIAAHQPFFSALRQFVEMPRQHVTFLTGNHDIELCFAEVRTRLYQAFNLEPGDPRIYFCPTRFYLPLPDVYVEHGNHYDFWNHRIEGLWDENGQPLTSNPATIQLPVGSLYVQEVTHILNMQYPYFDHFEPSMNTIRQIGLLSLLNPDFLQELVKKTNSFLALHKPVPSQNQQILLPDLKSLPPVELFSQTILDFARLQQVLTERKNDWDTSQVPNNQAEDLQEFARVREALALPLDKAVTTICIPAVYQMEKSVATGLKHVLHNDSTLRYAIAGHTHMRRFTPTGRNGQVYINTGTWTERFAQPGSDAIQPELINWLRTPNWQQIPLRDVTKLSFVYINGAEDRSSDARLCVWDGNTQESYQILSEEEGNEIS